MKVIDLLNLIASGKQPPKYIKWLGKIYLYVGIDYIARPDDEDEEWSSTHLMDNIGLCTKWLNEEVEVLDHE